MSRSAARACFGGRAQSEISEFEEDASFEMFLGAPDSADDFSLEKLVEECGFANYIVRASSDDVAVRVFPKRYVDGALAVTERDNETFKATKNGIGFTAMNFGLDVDDMQKMRVTQIQRAVTHTLQCHNRYISARLMPDTIVMVCPLLPTTRVTHNEVVPIRAATPGVRLEFVVQKLGAAVRRAGITDQNSTSTQNVLCLIAHVNRFVGETAESESDEDEATDSDDEPRRRSGRTSKKRSRSGSAPPPPQKRKRA